MSFPDLEGKIHEINQDTPCSCRSSVCPNLPFRKTVTARPSRTLLKFFADGNTGEKYRCKQQQCRRYSSNYCIDFAVISGMQWNVRRQKLVQRAQRRFTGPAHAHGDMFCAENFISDHSDLELRYRNDKVPTCELSLSSSPEVEAILCEGER